MVDTVHIQLAHGGGGQLTAELIRDVILPSLAGASSQDVGQLTDAAVLALNSSGKSGSGQAVKLAFTTDSYVVQPLEFPGGDIGKLAVCGTVNDLAVVGARPLALSLAMVLEEGLEISLLRRVLESAGKAASNANVKIVTGDTKVVERGRSSSLTDSASASGASGMILNTGGVGELLPSARLGFKGIETDDKILLSGPLGEHGLAVMSKRKGLSFMTDLKSDCAAINGLCQELIEKFGEQVRFMRDPTRGGLAATLVDLAVCSGKDVEIEEAAIPVNRTARSAAEMLGLDLLTVANEGKLVAVVAPQIAEQAVKALSLHRIASQAAVIGTVGEASDSPLVEMVTNAGGQRIVQMPYGEELPRIC